jgi:hypothetical protein
VRAAFAADRSQLPELVIHYLPLDRQPRSFVVSGSPQRIVLNPTSYQAAADFVARGFRRVITGGPAQLLLLLALMLPVRRMSEAVAAACAFIGGHSLALFAVTAGSAPSGAWFAPLTATLTAATVLAVALQNIAGINVEDRWRSLALFGLAHGLAFGSGFMQDVQFAGPHTLLAVLAFDVGTALAEAATLVIAIAALALLMPEKVRGRVGVLLVSALIGDIAWHWLLQSGEALWQAEWPSVDARGQLQLIRWLAIVLVAIGAATLVGNHLKRSWSGSDKRAPADV